MTIKTQKEQCIEILERRCADYVHAAKLWETEGKLDISDRCTMRAYIMREAIEDIRKNVS